MFACDGVYVGRVSMLCSCVCVRFQYCVCFCAWGGQRFCVYVFTIVVVCKFAILDLCVCLRCHYVGACVSVQLCVGVCGSFQYYVRACVEVFKIVFMCVSFQYWVCACV